MPSFKEVLAKRLKQARTDAGLTQAKLAAAVNSCGVSCTQSQIAGYENAASRSTPDAEKLAAIAKALEKSADWLCGLDIKGNSEAESKTISPNLWLRHFLAIISDPLITEGLKVEGGLPADAHRPNIEYINHVKAERSQRPYARRRGRHEPGNVQARLAAREVSRRAVHRRRSRRTKRCIQGVCTAVPGVDAGCVPAGRCGH